MCRCSQVGSENNTGPLGDVIDPGELSPATIAAIQALIDAAIADVPDAPVDSVNGETGVVTIDSDDISDTAKTHKFTTAGDISKLAGIESGATADQTASEILTAIKTVDGSGSGLDADLLDGHDTAYFQAALGFTAENVANKDTDSTFAANSDTKYPSQKAVKTGLDGKQPLDATLTALAGVTTAADKLIYATGIDTFSTTDLTSFARSLLDDPAAVNARATLGLSIGSNVQAYSDILLALAGVSAAAGKLPYFTGASSISLLDIIDPTTFTPNFQNVANVASFGTQSSGFYMRFNDFILFFGRISIDPTSGSSNTEFTMDLPVASNFSLFTDCGGTFACVDAVSISGGIRAETTADKATFKYFNTAETANKEFSYIGGYRVI